MRIISQNRNHSVNFDRVYLWMQENIIYADFCNKRLVLGAYVSNGRAAEVFLDIHKAYAPVGIVATNLSEEQIKPFIGSENVGMNVIRTDNPDYEVTTFDNYVYYMPEE